LKVGFWTLAPTQILVKGNESKDSSNGHLPLTPAFVTPERSI
jgi:hypothetical protein